MTWHDEWKGIRAHLDAWQNAAEMYMQGHSWIPERMKATADILVAQAHSILDRIKALQLPPEIHASNAALSGQLRPLSQTVEGPQGVMSQIIVLQALKGPIEAAFLASEEPRRHAVERAFLHLDRLLVADKDARATWRQAFDVGEPRCEALGALHFLQHGIYAFKADMGTGRTDLILSDPVQVGEVRSALMVLTEWKLARQGDNPAAVAREGLKQAKRYARVELGGFELKHTRYVVLVSLAPVPVPSTEKHGDVHYEFYNVVIERKAPSGEARSRD